MIPELQQTGEPEIDGGRPNGFVIVVLEPDLPIVDVDDLRRLAAQLDLDDLARFLNRLAEIGGGTLQTERVISRERLDDLRRVEERARRRDPDRPRRSLASFWRVDVREIGDPADLARELAAIFGVDTAYAEAQVSDTCASSTSAAVAVLSQRYLDPAPDGIDARWAWTRVGGRGEGCALVDVEQGWRVSHPALAPFEPLLMNGGDRINRDGFRGHVGAHGTSVIGIVGVGGPRAVGIAPGVASVRACSHYDGKKRLGLHVADAVTQATAALPEGGVLLLEVGRDGADGRELPTEMDLADLQAIQDAARAGVVVVEAAGNGKRDVDLWQAPGTGRRMVRDHPDWDSGAIMVGAAESEFQPDGGHLRWNRTQEGSNFGLRVDCYAWGELVAAATATGVSGVGYRPDFDATSAASAIVAGAALLTQGMATAIAPAAWLDSRAMRTMFLAHGTPCSPSGGPEPIGVMPDLRKIATELGAPPRP